MATRMCDVCGVRPADVPDETNVEEAARETESGRR